MSQSLNERYIYLVFYLFKHHVIKWDFTNIKIGMTSDDKYQKVCKYLQALNEKDSYDIKKLIKESKPLPITECQAIIQNKIAVHLKLPNFYYINSFVTFVDEQLTRLEQSVYFQPDTLEMQMPSSLFGPSQKKQAKEFHYDIVKNLVDLAREISIVEKFQDSQPS